MVGATAIIVILRRRGECKPQTKAYLCQMDRFSQAIAQTGQNYLKKTSSACWIHEARKRREALVLSDKFQMSLPFAEQVQVIKLSISELVSSKTDHINSVSSEDKVKNKVQHAQNDVGNAFGR